MTTRLIAPILSPEGVRMNDDYLSSIIASIEARLIAGLDRLQELLERDRERALLARMDWRELKDIGVTHGEIGQIAERPAPPRD